MPFGRRAQVDHDALGPKRFDIDAAATEDAPHAGIRILHIRRRVAVHRQHFVVAEFAIAGAILRQIGILQRPDADGLRHALPLLRRKLRTVGIPFVILGDDRRGPIHGFVEQALEADGIARARLIRPAVFAEHRAEADVSKVAGVVPGELRRGEQVFEVQALPMVDDVQHGIRLPALDAVLDRRQIGRRVKKRAVLLTNEHRRFLAGQEDTERAVALAR